MSLIGKIIGKAAASPIEAVGNVFDKLFTSDDEKAAAAAVMEKLRQAPHVLQAEINKIEAAHRSLFVVGWRPFIGWVGGGCLAWSFIGAPMVDWAARLAGATVSPPAIPTDMIFELVLGLIGLGGLRTFEKLRGAAK